MTTRQSTQARRRVAALAFSALTLAPGGTALVLGVPSAVADTGTLSIEPAEGAADAGAIRLISNRGCPSEATNILVEISGAGFPQGSNAVGNSEVSGFRPPPAGEGLVIPLIGSWEAVAEANGGKPNLDGMAKLTLHCTDNFASQSLGQIVGEVRFSKDGEGPSRYAQVGGPHLESGVARVPADLPAEIPQDEPYAAGTAASGVDQGDTTNPENGPATEDDQATVAEEAAADVAGELDSAEAAPSADGSATATSGVQKPDTDLTASGRTASPSKTPLLVGIAVFLAAGLAGGTAYARARRTIGPPT